MEKTVYYFYVNNIVYAKWCSKMDIHCLFTTENVNIDSSLHILFNWSDNR